MTARKSPSSVITIELDLDARAAYLRFKTGKVARTVDQDDRFLVDVDRSGQLLGVEILQPEKLSIKECRSAFADLSRKYRNPLIKRFHPEKLTQVFAA